MFVKIKLAICTCLLLISLPAKAGNLSVVHVDLKFNGSSVCQLEPHLYSYGINVIVTLANNSSAKDSPVILEPLTPSGIRVSRDSASLAKEIFEQDSFVDSFDDITNTSQHHVGQGKTLSRGQTVTLFVSTDLNDIGHGTLDKGTHLLQLRYIIRFMEDGKLKESTVTSSPVIIDLTPPSNASRCG